MVENAVSTERVEVPAVILAGGLSRRMGGGDKALMDLAGRPMLARVIERLRPQAAPIALNANGDPRRFARFGLPVIADSVPDFAGPLAGILAALDWAAALPGRLAAVLVVPVDAPFLPRDLVARLDAARSEAVDAVLAESGGRLHPVVGLWSLGQREPLRRALTQEGLRKVEAWVDRIAAARVSFAAAPVDPFTNLNRPEDFAAAALLEGAEAQGAGES